MNNFYDAIVIGESFTTNTTCGGIASGTSIASTDKLNTLIKNMLYQEGPVEPSTGYENKYIGTWSSISDVNSFFTTYTYNNGWAGLKVGNYVTISDGTYNKDWYIAGFNTETANDGVAGGIAFIPKTNLTTYNWHSTYTSATAYKNSAIHSYINGTVKNALYNVVGSHMVNRTVKLGSAQSGTSPRSWVTSAYTTTTAYLTLMTPYQLGLDSSSSYCNAYDDGEANYCLRLFDSSYGSGNYLTTSAYANSENVWFRNVYGKYSSSSYFYAWYLYSVGAVDYRDVSYTLGVRPLMYLR